MGICGFVCVCFFVLLQTLALSLLIYPSSAWMVPFGGDRRFPRERVFSVRRLPVIQRSVMKQIDTEINGAFKQIKAQTVPMCLSLSNASCSFKHHLDVVAVGFLDVTS